MKARKLDGFDVIAPVYDRLALLVFGKSIRNAQLCFLNEVPNGGNVLILGGGTGWLLGELLKVNPYCKVWYVEASSRMLAMTRKVIPGHATARIHYIHGTIELLPQGVKFHGVIANFYFDLFSSLTLTTVLHRITESMPSNGILLASDFTKGTMWQRMFLAVMYSFFRLICNIEAMQLPDWQAQLMNFEFYELKSKMYYRNFIKSAVYKKG